MPARKRVLAALAILTVVALPLLAAEEGEHESWIPTLGRVFNFAVLAGTLAYLLKKPLAEYLRARTDQIRQELQDAAQKRKQAEADREAALAKLKNVDEDVMELGARAKAEAEGERNRILAAAEVEANRIRDAARREIEAEVEIARRKLVRHATELAIDLARKKLETNVNARDRAELLEKGLKRLKEVR